MDYCIYCQSKQLYHLKNSHIKCAKCKRKFSLVKYKRVLSLLKAFCHDYNALQCSKELNVNYITVCKYYQEFRRLIIAHLDEIEQNRQERSTEYDEYIYIKNDNLYSAQNFLTFAHHQKVYNLMLPSLYKFRTFDKSEEELSKFLFLNKIAKIESKYGVITEFWNYLENFMKKFKGVDSSNFIYYLKEAEFKFNYESNVQEKILLERYYQK